jgi:hypothetical protein
MTTKRESFIQGLIAAFSAAPDFPAAIERTLDGAFTSDQGNVLVVHRGDETVTMDMDGGAERNCTIVLSTVTRGGNPEGESDRILEAAYPLIMGFKAEGLMPVTERGTAAPKFSDRNECLLISAQFNFRYITSPGSLSS